MSILKLALWTSRSCGGISKIVFPNVQQLSNAPTERQIFSQTIRFYSVKKSRSVVESNEPVYISSEVKRPGHRVKENAKTATFATVILVGLGITTIILYNVFDELLNSDSPTQIYGEALKICLNDPEVTEALGTPIKGYAETSHRNRRNRVGHSYYQKDGDERLRVQFYLRGTRNEATAQADMKKVNGKFEYRYLLIQLHDYSSKIIVLKDNRSATDNQKIEISNELKSIL